LSSIAFSGGPLDGMSGPDPAAAPAEEAAAPDLKSLLADLRAFLQSEEYDAKQKLAISKAESLLAGVEAQEQKEQEDAMGGKLSPGILRKLGSGGA
jgi:hypothetical protein